MHTHLINCGHVTERTVTLAITHKIKLNQIKLYSIWIQKSARKTKDKLHRDVCLNQDMQVNSLRR